MLARLNIKGPDTDFTHDVREGKTLMIGSGAACGLKLPSPRVSSLHCWISFADGVITVNDCYSDAGTIVNGERIEVSTQIDAGTEVQVGDFLIRVAIVDQSGILRTRPTARPEPAEPVPHDSEHALFDDTDDISSVVHGGAQQDTAAGSATVPAEAAAFPRPDAAEQCPSAGATAVADDGSALQSELRRVQAEADELRLQLAEAHSQLSRVGQPKHYQSDPFDKETIEMLRAELELLQDELAERDAQLQQLQDGSTIDLHGEAAASGETTTESETATLVDRLEQLLDELQQSDERVGSLEEMLRLADEATLAEQDERRQLEAWVSDIEERIIQREADWTTEKESLQRQAEELRAERDRAERGLQESAREGDMAVPMDGLIDGLREQIERLQTQLREVESQRDALQKQVTQGEDQFSEDACRKRVEELLREERAALMQERAEFSRQRAEIERIKRDFDHERKNMPDEVNQRVRALRMHLRDIHEQEEEERRQRSLSSRISRIWKRLEG